MIYARELLAYFADRPDLELHAIISAAGEQVLDLELGLTPSATSPRGRLAPGGRLYRAHGQRLVSGPGHGDCALLHGEPGGHRPGGRPQPDPPGRRGLSEGAAALILVVRETPL